MVSLKIPPLLFWFPLWGTSSYYHQPEFVSHKLQDVGGLKKKKKNQQHQQLQKTTQQQLEHKKSLNFEQRAG